jgi:hypothetical protein
MSHAARRTAILLACLLFLLVMFSPAAQAATYRVPEDYPLIQAAIDAAAPGDIIQIGPGTYIENLVAAGKSLSLVGTAGAVSTIVDGQGLGSVLVLYAGLVEGLTLRNGKTGYGGGIHLVGTGPTTIRACMVSGNTAQSLGCVDPCGDGGGIYVGGGYDDGELVIENNVIENNNCWGSGGGIGGSGFADVRDNVIRGNAAWYAGGGVWLAWGVVQRNLVVGNATPLGSGGGVFLVYGECRSNTVVGNSSLDYAVSMSEGTITGNIIAGNLGVAGSGGFGLRGPSTSRIVECNDAWGNEGADFVLGSADTTGTHNFSADPLFCGTDDYHVSTSSPCANFATCGLIGALPPDCGVTAARRSTWGAIKRAYR